MSDARRIKILIKHFEIAIKTSSENFDYYPISHDHWIIRMRGLAGRDDMYLNGEYLIDVTAPKEYPFKPPSFQFLTPNGRFELKGKICVSNGEFHSQNYQQNLSIYGFIKNLISIMLNESDLQELKDNKESELHGIRINNNPSIEAVKKYAMVSKSYNSTNYPEYTEKLNQHRNKLNEWKPDNVPGLLIAPNEETAGIIAKMISADVWTAEPF